MICRRGSGANLSADEDMAQESRQLPFEKMRGRDFPCWLVPPTSRSSSRVDSGLGFSVINFYP